MVSHETDSSAENLKKSHAEKVFGTLKNSNTPRTPLKELNFNADNTDACSKDFVKSKKSVTKKGRRTARKSSSLQTKKPLRLSARNSFSVGNEPQHTPRTQKLKKYATKVYFDFEEGFKKKSPCTHNKVLTKAGDGFIKEVTLAVKSDDQIEKEEPVGKLESGDHVTKCETGKLENAESGNVLVENCAQLVKFVSGDLFGQPQSDSAEQDQGKLTSGDLLKEECAEFATSDYEDQFDGEVMMTEKSKKSESGVGLGGIIQILHLPRETNLESSVESSTIVESSRRDYLECSVQSRNNYNQPEGVLSETVCDSYSNDVSLITGLLAGYCFESPKSQNTELGLTQEWKLSHNKLIEQSDVNSDIEGKLIDDETTEIYSQMVTNLEKVEESSEKNSLNSTSEDAESMRDAMNLAFVETELGFASIESTNDAAISDLVGNDSINGATELSLTKNKAMQLEETKPSIDGVIELSWTEKKATKVELEETKTSIDGVTELYLTEKKATKLELEETKTSIDGVTELYLTEKKATKLELEETKTSIDGLTEYSLTENKMTKLEFEQTKTTNDATVLDVLGHISESEGSNLASMKVESTNEGADMSLVEHEAANSVLNLALVQLYSANEEGNVSVLEVETKLVEPTNRATNLALIKFESTEETNSALGDVKSTSEAISGISKKYFDDSEGENSTSTDVVARSIYTSFVFGGKIRKVFDYVPSAVKSVFGFPSGSSGKISITGHNAKSLKKSPPLSASKKRKYSRLVESLKRRPLSDYNKSYTIHGRKVSSSQLVRSPLHKAAKKIRLSEVM